MSSDQKIISELRKGSQVVFKKIYYQYNNLIYYHAFNILNNKEDAEDVMQNVFIKFMNNIAVIDDNSNIKQLLSKMSKNEAIDLYRKKANKKEIFDENYINNVKDNEDYTKANVILTLNNLLDKKNAHILILKIVYDYSFSEISEELDEPISTIQTYYKRSLKKLKKFYKGGKHDEL